MESLSTLNPLCSSRKNARFSIALITATRAEWGLLSPLARALHSSPLFELRLIITGAHLCEELGDTKQEVLDDFPTLPHIHSIPILTHSRDELGIAHTTANAIARFSEYFARARVDMAVILGDRYEMLGIAYACANLKIPIAHICGGESTQGANDEYIRHCITKMSYLHFATTEAYRRRIIQLGEEPHRVFNVGSLAVENILHTPLFAREELARFLNVKAEFLENFCVLTYHPVTLESAPECEQIRLICECLLHSPYQILATKANADAQGELINEVLQSYAAKYPTRFILRASLGKRAYLSSLKLARFMIGNSSSALGEGLIMRVPSINIGARQQGRLKNACVIDCALEKNEIERALKRVSERDFLTSIASLPHLFGKGDTSRQILTHLTHFLSTQGIELKKPFYDVEIQTPINQSPKPPA